MGVEGWRVGGVGLGFWPRSVKASSLDTIVDSIVDKVNRASAGMAGAWAPMGGDGVGGWGRRGIWGAGVAGLGPTCAHHG